MLGQAIIPKYLDHIILVVDVKINYSVIPNTLIKLTAIINVMTEETILRLNLQGSLGKLPWYYNLLIDPQ